MPEDTLTMKEKLLETVGHLRDDEINLEETPALFRWIYPEEPQIEFQLLIKERNIDPLVHEIDSTVH